MSDDERERDCATPQLTVVIVATRDDTHLVTCIDSVLAEEAVAEVLIVAEAIRDFAATIAHKAALEDERVRFLEMEGLANPGAGINAGLLASRSEYVAFPEPDGVVPRGSYARVLSVLSRSGSDLIVSSGEMLGSGGDEVSPSGVAVGPAVGVTLAARPALIEDDSPATKVFRRSFLLDRGLRASPSHREDDTLLAVTALASASSIDVDQGPVLFRRPTREVIDAGFSEEVLDRDLNTLAALRVVAPEAAVRAYAVLLLRRDVLLAPLHPGEAGEGFAETAAKLVRLASDLLHGDDIAAMRMEERWALASVSVGAGKDPQALGEFLETVGPDISFPEPILSGLGLGAGDLPTAARKRFSHGGSNGQRGGIVTDYSGPPEISVVMVVGAHGEGIDATLSSIRVAQDVRIEIVVVLDASSESAWERVAKHAVEDARVRVFKSVGRGAGQAYNFGVEVATGRYVVFVDRHDFVPPRAYARLLAAAQRTDAEIVCGSRLEFSAESTVDLRHSFEGLYSIEVDDVTLSQYPHLVRDRAITGKLVLRDFWLASSFPLRNELKVADFVAYVSALTVARRVSVIPDSVYVERKQPRKTWMAGVSDSSSLAVTYFSEEILCARLIASSPSSVVILPHYWDMVLTTEGWRNLRRVLALDGPSEEAESVVLLVKQLLDMCPPAFADSLRPEVQAAWRLFAAGDLKSAAVMRRILDRSSSLTIAEVLSALSASAAVTEMPKHVTARLVREHVLRRIVADPAVRTADGIDPARRFLRELEQFVDMGAHLPPGSWEDRLWRSSRVGTRSMVLRALRPLPPHPAAVLAGGIDGASISGEAAPEAITYRRLVGVREGTKSPRYVLGPARYSAATNTWEAEVDLALLSSSPRWLLEVELDDQWGPRRAPLVLKESASSTAERHLVEVRDGLISAV